MRLGRVVVTCFSFVQVLSPHRMPIAVTRSLVGATDGKCLVTGLVPLNNCLNTEAQFAVVFGINSTA